MLLAVDVGNTQTHFGTYRDGELVEHWRFATVRESTADELATVLVGLLHLRGLTLDDVGAAIVSSVVPQLVHEYQGVGERYLGGNLIVVGPGLRSGIPIRTERPHEVGADRLVNAVAGFTKYGGPCIVVDLGTTINFDIVSANKEFVGGVICPGIGMSISGLFAKTARLPMVDFREPEKLIGSNTVGSITSGLYYGFIGMIDGIVERVTAELGPKTKAVATGGQGHLIAKASRFVKIYDEDLTLHGLRLIWQRCANP